MACQNKSDSCGIGEGKVVMGRKIGEAPPSLANYRHIKGAFGLIKANLEPQQQHKQHN